MKPCSWIEVSVLIMCSLFACTFLGFKVSFALIFSSQGSLFFMQVVYYIGIEGRVAITSVCLEENLWCKMNSVHWRVKCDSSLNIKLSIFS